MLHFKYGKLLRITRQLVNTIALAIPNWLQRATRLQQAGDCFCTKLSFFPNVSQSGQARRSDRCSTSTCGFVSSKSHGYTTFSSLALYVYVCDLPASTSFHQPRPLRAVGLQNPEWRWLKNRRLRSRPWLKLPAAYEVKLRWHRCRWCRLPRQKGPKWLQAEALQFTVAYNTSEMYVSDYPGWNIL